MLDKLDEGIAGGPAIGEKPLDVVIIGAGLSGICAAAHLAQSRPQDDFMILEAREAMGGTWDLFRYPGVRSDSDMFTLGYGFRPWTDGATLADGPSIRDYIRETAQAHDLERRVAYGCKVVAADWSSQEARWTLTVETAEGRKRVKAGFVICCAGYYDYDQGYTPEFPGVDQFEGRLVHPQDWPEDLELEGRKFAVIGSGATAITLVPALADRGAKVTMVQRTPTYVMSLPGQDAVVRLLQRALPEKSAYRLARLKNILGSMYIFQMAKLAPGAVRRLVQKNAREELGEDAGVETHFNPPYDPWDQRFCVAPDGDFFKAIKRGDAEIVTGGVESFTPRGLKMKDGREIEADVIVTATGLRLKLLGGVALTVDGEPRNLADSFSYRGAMFSGVPNLGFTFGYTNASWTLKCELIVKWLIRLLDRMERTGAKSATPTPPAGMAERDFVGLSSGYIQRAKHILPKQGAQAPWAVHQNYIRDIFAFQWARLGKGLVFAGPGAPAGTADAEAEKAGAAKRAVRA